MNKPCVANVDLHEDPQTNINRTFFIYIDDFNAAFAVLQHSLHQNYVINSLIHVMGSNMLIVTHDYSTLRHNVLGVIRVMYP